MTEYLMCIYWGHICIFILNVKFLSLILWLGGLCTDTNDDNDTNDNADTDDTDNYAQQKNHDYIGSFGKILNEPKTSLWPIKGHFLENFNVLTSKV